MIKIISEKHFGREISIVDLLHAEAEISNQVFNNNIISVFQTPLKSTYKFKGKEIKENFEVGDVGIYSAGVYDFVKNYNSVNKIHMYIAPQFLNNERLKDFGIKEFELKTIFKTQDNFLKEIILLLHKEINQINVDNLYIDSLLITLTLHLYKNYSNPKELLLVKGRLQDNEIYKIRNYILNNISENISLKDLADIVNLSEFHFSRLFKKATGYSPYFFTRKTKIDYAKELMKSNLSISEIANLSGFNESSHFSKVFKQIIGVSPSVFRESN